MARPKKNKEDAYSEYVPTRFTKAERAKLEHAANTHGVTISDFIRRCSLGHRLPPVKTDQEAWAKMTSALIRLGVNLNQLTKVANIKEKVLPNMLYDLIVRINEAMDQLDESYRN